MPNWSYNHITMDRKTFEENKHLFIKENKDGEYEVDFGILIPQPHNVIADLYYGGLDNDHNTDVNTNITDEENITESFFVYGEKTKLKEIMKDRQGWYDWRCEHWGCKWNGGCASIEELDDDVISVEFSTAWSNPYPFFEELAKHCNFSTSSIEEAGFFNREGYAENGEYTEYDVEEESEE